MVKDLLARFDTCPDFKKTKLLHVLHTNHSVSSNRDVIKWQNIETQCQYNIDTLMTPCYAWILVAEVFFLGKKEKYLEIELSP